MRPRGEKKEMYKIKINEHLTLSYRNCHEANEEEEEEKKGNVRNQDNQTPHTLLQKLSPKLSHTPLTLVDQLYFICKRKRKSISVTKKVKKKYLQWFRAK